MQYVSQEQLIQELAVLRKSLTGITASYDRTIEILNSLNPEELAPRDVSKRLLSLAMSVDRPIVEAIQKSVGANNISDVKFFDAKAGYLLKIASVLYDDKESDVIDSRMKACSI